jgi:tetratricopeptide (TPR) repeat protein
MKKHRAVIAIGIVFFVSVMYFLNSRKPDRNVELLAYVERAQQAKEAKDLPTAEREYMRALEIDSTNVVVLNNLANVFVGRSKDSAAVKLYERISRIDPGYKLADCNRAIALLALGDTLEAMRVLTNLLGTTELEIRDEALRIMTPVLSNTVYKWSEAWERTAVRHDITEYEKFYSREFSSQTEKMAGKNWNYSNWMEDQKKKAARKKTIEVQILNFVVTADQYGVKATFCQLYHSTDDGVRDEGRKELRFRVENEGIKIVAENWSPEKCKPGTSSTESL